MQRNVILQSPKHVQSITSPVLLDPGEERFIRVYPDSVAALGWHPYVHLRRKANAIPFYNRWTPWSVDRAFFTNEDVDKLVPTFTAMFQHMMDVLKTDGAVLMPHEEELLIPEILEKAPQLAAFLRANFTILYAQASEVQRINSL